MNQTVDRMMYGAAALVAIIIALVEIGQPIRIMEMGLILSVIVTPAVAYGQFKTAATHLGLILMVLGGWISGVGSTPLDLPVLCFLLAATVATIVSPRSGRFGTLPRQFRGDGLISTMGLCVTALAAARLPALDREILLGACVLTGFVIAAIGCGQARGWVWARNLGGAKQKPGQDGSWGTLGNPVMQGGYLCLLLPIVLLYGPWGLIPASIMTMALFATRSRASMLGVLTAAAVLIWKLPWQLVTTPLLAGLGFGSLWSQTMFEKITEYQLKVGSVDRTWLWGWLAAKIVKRPVIGWGLNSIAVPLPPDDPRRVREKHETAHSELFQIAHDTGLLGLGCYLWIWVVALHHATLNGVTIGLISYAVWLLLNWNTIGSGNVCWFFLGLAVR